MSKWCNPVGITLPVGLPPRRRERVLGELEALSRLTAVDFRIGGDPGIKMHYPLSWTEREAVTASLPVGSPAQRRRLDGSRCFFVLQAESGTGCLLRADIVIPDELDDAAYDHCVAEEVTQAMGLPNDFDAGDASLFSSTGRAPGRTSVDDLFLQILYDPALEPGAGRAELEPVLPGVIDRHR